MFIDEIKIYAQAGHGGKGCVAFHREAYITKGGPSGGNGGRGGSVILEADHDLNNLIAQYYHPRLIAQDGQFGIGNGMDGKAGKDLVIKVPCGTLVWQLGPEPAEHAAKHVEEEEEADDATLQASSSHRPRFRTATGGRALEVDLSAEGEERATLEVSERRMVADLTEHGQRFVLCNGGRGRPGDPELSTGARQTPRLPRTRQP